MEGALRTMRIKSGPWTVPEELEEKTDIFEFIKDHKPDHQRLLDEFISLTGYIWVGLCRLGNPEILGAGGTGAPEMLPAVAFKVVGALRHFAPIPETLYLKWANQAIFAAIFHLCGEKDQLIVLVGSSSQADYHRENVEDLLDAMENIYLEKKEMRLKNEKR